MTTTSECPHCDKEFVYDPSMFGRDAECVECKVSFVIVPHPSSDIGWYVKVGTIEYGPIPCGEIQKWIHDQGMPSGTQLRPADSDTWIIASRLFRN